jgi:photosystem II stability/assembly factor-like uncharacterized protein
MEPEPVSRLTGRKRRAVGLIAISLLALGAAGMTWIVPTLHLGDPKTTAGQVLPVPSPQIFPSTYEFATMSIGWAVFARPTETTVFKTVDGGKHWRPSGRLAASYGASMHFLDTTHGFVVTGNPQHVYRTTDGGAHWIEMVMPEERTYSMTFTDRRRGSLLAPPRPPNLSLPVTYTTDDGGDTWRRLPDPPADSYGPVFRNAEAWLSSNSSGSLHVYTSYDGGLSWSPVDVPRPPASQPVSKGPVFANAQVTLLPGAGVAVYVAVGPSCGKPAPCLSSDDAQFVSFDRGNTWTAVPPPPKAFSYRDIVYQDAVHWWAMASGSVFKSSNSGQTWELVSSVGEGSGPAVVLHVIDSQHAWAEISVFQTRAGGSYRASAVAFTTDGGLSWKAVTPPKVF